MTAHDFSSFLALRDASPERVRAGFELGFELEVRLRDLALWRRRQFVILEQRGTGRYVQYLTSPDGGLYAEASANWYVAPAYQLDALQQHKLVTLGWALSRVNYVQRWNAPVEYQLAACVTARTFMSVFDVRNRDELTITYGRRADRH